MKTSSSTSTRISFVRSFSSVTNFSSAASTLALPKLETSGPTLAFKWRERGKERGSEIVLAGGWIRVAGFIRDESVRENEIHKRPVKLRMEGGIDRGRKSNFYDVLRGVRNERRLRYPVTMGRPVVPY